MKHKSPPATLFPCANGEHPAFPVGYESEISSRALRSRGSGSGKDSYLEAAWLEMTAGDSHLTAGGHKTLLSKNGFCHLDTVGITGGHNEMNVSSQQVFLQVEKCKRYSPGASPSICKTIHVPGLARLHFSVVITVFTFHKKISNKIEILFVILCPAAPPRHLIHYYVLYSLNTYIIHCYSSFEGSVIPHYTDILQCI